MRIAVKSYSERTFRPWIWALIPVGAVIVRLPFLFQGDIAFRSDDAILADWVHKWGGDDRSDLAATWRVVDGIRLWMGMFFDRISAGWPGSMALVALLLRVAGLGLWILWAFKRISPYAAAAVAAAFLFPPLSDVYFSTVPERRQVTILLAAILALGTEKWAESARSAAAFGFIAAWGLWEESLFLFFVLPAGYLSWRFKGTANWMPALAGFALGASWGIFRNLEMPDFPEGHLRFGLADWAGMKRNIALLFGAYPDFHSGNLPFGYLQNTPLGRWVDPIGVGWPAAIGPALAWVWFASAAGAYAICAVKRKELHPALIMTGFPAVLLALFFVVSEQTWDFVTFRYFSYFLVFQGMGMGLAVHMLIAKRRGFALGLVILWIGGWGSLWFQRSATLPALHAADKVSEGLARSGFTAGYANYWISEVVRFRSGERILLTPFNSPAFSRRAWEAVGSHGRIALVVVEGLDREEGIQRCLESLRAVGFRPVRRIDFPGRWYAIELMRNRRPG